MKNIHESLIWAGIILGAAVYSNYAGLSDAASYGIAITLTGAAWVSIQSGRRGCTKGCA
ncbi:MAG: hypothetical protein AAGH57_12855 [Pseudomonadota bacterium]